MSRHAALNLILGALAIGLVGWVAYLETADASSAPIATATTSSVSTTPSPTIPATTIPATTIPSPTIPATTISATTIPATSTTSTSTTTSTVAPTTIPPTTLPPPERGVVPVVVTSASLAGERVGPTVYLLSLGGWTDVRGLNGAVQVPATVVYFADGFQNAAEVMAVDLQIPVTSVAPLATAPPVAGLGNAALVVYVSAA